jgi:hypothetical protein
MTAVVFNHKASSLPHGRPANSNTPQIKVKEPAAREEQPEQDGRPPWAHPARKGGLPIPGVD